MTQRVKFLSTITDQLISISGNSKEEEKAKQESCLLSLASIHDLWPTYAPMHRQVHNQQAYTKATYKLKVNENLKHL